MRTSLAVGEHETIDGVTLIAASDRWPRPHVAVFGGVHGNERCGTLGLERIVDEARRGVLPWREGTAVLVHGNVEASHQGRRYTEGGADLNRLFDFTFETSLPRARWTYEHLRAMELRPLLDDIDALIDLHSASAPTPPFAIATRLGASLELARALGLGWVVRGWEGPGLLGDRVILSVLTRAGKPAVALECGQHEDERAAEIAYRCARRFLEATGVLEPEPVHASAPPLLLRLTEVIKKPSPSFRFHRPLRGLERIERGTLIGVDRAIELRLRKASYALLPNDTVPVGDDMLYLAEPEPDPEQALTGPR